MDEQCNLTALFTIIKLKLLFQVGPLSILLIISVSLFPITSLFPLSLSSLSRSSAWSDCQGRGLMGLSPIGWFDGRGWQWRWWFVVGDCGPMGMGRGSDGPMVMVEVRRWRFLFHLFFFFFFLRWFVVVVLVWRGSWVTDPGFVCVWWVLVHRSGFGSYGFWFGVMGLLVVFVVVGWWLVVILVDGCGYTLDFFFFCSSCRGLWLPRWCCDLWWWRLWWVVVVTMVVGVVEEVVGWLLLFVA